MVLNIYNYHNSNNGGTLPTIDALGNSCYWTVVSMPQSSVTLSIDGTNTTCTNGTNLYIGAKKHNPLIGFSSAPMGLYIFAYSGQDCSGNVVSSNFSLNYFGNNVNVSGIFNTSFWPLSSTVLTPNITGGFSGIFIQNNLGQPQVCDFTGAISGTSQANVSTYTNYVLDSNGYSPNSYTVDFVPDNSTCAPRTISIPMTGFELTTWGNGVPFTGYTVRFKWFFPAGTNMSGIFPGIVVKHPTIDIDENNPIISIVGTEYRIEYLILGDYSTNTNITRHMYHTIGSSQGPYNIITAPSLVTLRNA